jgi:tetratricopeptide (TPR) repeat protein
LDNLLPPLFLASLAALGCATYVEGEQLLRAGQARAAAEAIHPRDSRGHALRAEALLLADEPEEARGEIRAALAERPRDVSQLLLLARIEHAAHRPGAALTALARAAKRDPDHPDLRRMRAELLVERAQSLAALERPRASEQAYAQALELAPALARQTSRPAPPEALAAGGAPADAEEERLRRALADGPRQTALQAIADWVDGDAAVSARGPRAAQWLDAAGERDAALAIDERIVAEDPGDPGARLELVRALLALGRPARALQEIDEAVYAATDRPSAMRQAALLLERAGHLQKACALRARALAFGVDAEAFRALGECLDRAGQKDQARALFEKVQRPTEQN